MTQRLKDSKTASRLLGIGPRTGVEQDEMRDHHETGVYDHRMNDTVKTNTETKDALLKAKGFEALLLFAVLTRAAPNLG
jgi:hypothetical protein